MTDPIKEIRKAYKKDKLKYFEEECAGCIKQEWSLGKKILLLMLVAMLGGVTIGAVTTRATYDRLSQQDNKLSEYGKEQASLKQSEKDIKEILIELKRNQEKGQENIAAWMNVIDTKTDNINLLLVKHIATTTGK